MPQRRMCFGKGITTPPLRHLRHLPRVFGSAPRPSAPDAHPDSQLIVPHTAHKSAEGASAAAVNGQAGEQVCEHARKVQHVDAE